MLYSFSYLLRGDPYEFVLQRSHSPSGVRGDGGQVDDVAEARAVLSLKLRQVLLRLLSFHLVEVRA